MTPLFALLGFAAAYAPAVRPLVASAASRVRIVSATDSGSLLQAMSDSFYANKRARLEAELASRLSELEEFEARERALWPPNKLDTLSTQVQDICCAEGQYAVLERIVADFGLTEGELDWLRRGRNASARGPRRLEPKVYRASTSLETLVGVLHLTDRARLAELFDFVWADKARPGSNLADPQASPQVDTAHG